MTAFQKLIGAVCISSFLLAVPARAATVTVDDMNDANTGGAVCTLRDAINSVNGGADSAGCAAAGAYGAGDTIVIPAGTYLIAGARGDDVNASGDLDIRAPVTIQGAGAGSTFLDGGGFDRLFHMPTGAATSFTGVTIRNGNPGNAVLWDKDGGGIYGIGGSITVTNSTISNNTSGDEGGGIYNEGGGSITVTNSTIGNNTAPVSGGGIYNWGGGAIAVTDSTISGNTALAGGGIFNSGGATTISGSTINANNVGASHGGGVYNLGGSLSVTSSTVSGNTAGTNGGGLYSSVDATVTGSTISGNTGMRGGGVYAGNNVTISYSTISGNATTNGSGGGVMGNNIVTITSSTVSGNTAANGGGGGVSSPFVTASNSTFSGNTAASHGGGIYNDFLSNITNCTISGNTSTAGNGGGANGTFVFTNVTIYNNNAGGNGGGVYAADATTLSNTIVAGNPGSDCFDGGGGFTSNGYNLDSDNTCWLNQATDIPGSAAANLGALANNGGSTQTHALLAGSAAIDEGSCVQATDQRGVSRPQYTGGACDIGAFELGQPNPAPAAHTLTIYISGPGWVRSDPAGIDCPGTCSASFASGTAVSLSTSNGLDGWGGDCDGQWRGAPCSLVMNTDHHVRAPFSAPSSGGGDDTSGGAPSDGAGDGGEGGNGSPFGMIMLISPEDGAATGSTVTFEWERVDGVDSFRFYICQDETFEGCEPRAVSGSVARVAMTGFGAVFVLGLLAGGNRRRIVLLIGVLFLAAWAGGCGETSSGSKKVTHSESGLAPGDYYWKVTADGYVSETRTLTVGE